PDSANPLQSSQSARKTWRSSSFYSPDVHPKTRMFAKRKPRPKADEPLVPHGLVWQATADTGSLEKSDREAEKVSPPARPIQIVPPTVEVAGSATPAVTQVPKKPAGSSPPLFWQKVTKPEIVKPVSNTAGSESSPAQNARVQPAASNDNTEVSR